MWRWLNSRGLKLKLHLLKIWAKWRPESRFSARKRLNPQERKLLLKFQKTMVLRRFFSESYLLRYFAGDDPEPLRKQWPILKEVDKYLEDGQGGKEFRLFVTHLKSKIRGELNKKINPDERFVSAARRH